MVGDSSSFSLGRDCTRDVAQPDITTLCNSKDLTFVKNFNLQANKVKLSESMCRQTNRFFQIYTFSLFYKTYIVTC